MSIDSHPNRFNRSFPVRGSLTAAALIAVLAAPVLFSAPVSAGYLEDVATLRERFQSGAFKVIDASSDETKDTRKPAMTGTETRAKSRLDVTLEETAPAQSGSPDLASTGTAAEADSEAVVDVETKTGSVEVSVGDGQPRENWFGRPPAAEAVESYLAGAETSGQAGDMAACTEQLLNARASLTVADK